MQVFFGSQNTKNDFAEGLQSKRLVAMTSVTTSDLNAGLEYLGKVLHVTPGQAMILTDNTQIHKFDNTAMNRNIDLKWVKIMKSEIKDMYAKGQLMTATVMLDTDDIIAYKLACDEVPDDFKCKIVDAQHRLEAMRQLRVEEPNTVYQFYATVYIVSSIEEERELFEKINKRKEMTQEDMDNVRTRERFLEAWNQLTVNNRTRQCVKYIAKSKKLRDLGVMDALSFMSTNKIKDNIRKIAETYKPEFERHSAHTEKFANSAVFKTIQSTKLYQLVNYASSKQTADEWIMSLQSCDSG